MNVLMVGLGGIGQRHLRNIRARLGADATVSAFRVRGHQTVLTEQLRIEEGAESLEARYNVRTYDDLDRALATNPTVTFICNPSSLHMEIALRAAKAGSHLFIEKPLSHTLEGVAELATELDKQRNVGFVGYQLRFHPCLQAAKRILDSGVLGQVLSVRAQVGEYLPNFHVYEDYRTMYAARADLGGGVVLSQIHEFDYLYWMFGLPKRAFALGGHLSSLELDVEDVASTLFEHSIHGRSVPVHVLQDYCQRPGRRTCEIVADRGKVDLDINGRTLSRYDESGALIESLEFPNFERNQLFLDELDHFLDCVKTRKTPLVSIRDGAASLQMAIAVKKSLATGRVEAMESIDV